MTIDEAIRSAAETVRMKIGRDRMVDTAIAMAQEIYDNFYDESVDPEDVLIEIEDKIWNFVS